MINKLKDIIERIYDMSDEESIVDYDELISAINNIHELCEDVLEGDLCD